MNLENLINDLIKHGKCCFTVDYAQKTLQKSRKAIFSSLEHLLAKGKVANPAELFYVIMSPEYSDLGCLPAEYFFPYLAEYWNVKYYACLLTAAAYHGATHQAAQVFQVMLEKPRKPIICGKVKINFIANKHLIEIPTENIATAKSFLKLSTPEGTAIDLVKYIYQSGGINHIATVISELCEAMSKDKLSELMEKQPELAWKQRLGYLLELQGSLDLAKAIKDHLTKQKRVDYIPIIPTKDDHGKYPKNPKWKIIETIKIESDL